MDYLEMVKAAKVSGKVSEKQMWESVESVSDMLNAIKEAHPDLYWSFIREQYGIMNNCHYGKEFAEYDVSQMYSTDKDGKKCEGVILTLAETEEMSKTWTLPSGTTKWDVFVALNSAMHDFGKYFDKEQVAKIACYFFFKDEDFKGKNKVWQYMAMVYEAADK